MISHISFDMKILGKRSAGNRHAAFDEAGAGNGKDGEIYMGTKLETTETDKIKPELYRASSRPYGTGGRMGNLPGLPPKLDQEIEQDTSEVLEQYLQDMNEIEEKIGLPVENDEYIKNRIRSHKKEITEEIQASKGAVDYEKIGKAHAKKMEKEVEARHDEHIKELRGVLAQKFGRSVARGKVNLVRNDYKRTRNRIRRGTLLVMDSHAKRGTLGGQIVDLQKNLRDMAAKRQRHPQLQSKPRVGIASRMHTFRSKRGSERKEERAVVPKALSDVGRVVVEEEPDLGKGRSHRI